MFVFQIRNVQVVLCYENDYINSRPEIDYNHFIFGMRIPLDTWQKSIVLPKLQISHFVNWISFFA